MHREAQRRTQRLNNQILIMQINEVTATIIGAGIKVHSKLGPGLLESAYQRCLQYELAKAGMKIESDVFIPLGYGEVVIDAGYRIDLLVDSKVIVEVKAVQLIAPIHRAQILTYLKLSKLKIGLLLNFNVTSFKQGIERLIL